MRLSCHLKTVMPPHPRKLYIVNLTDDERTQLIKLTQKGALSARKLKRANILLLADQGQTDADIAALLHCGHATVERTRKRFVCDGPAEGRSSIEAALNEKKRPGGKAKLDDKAEAILATMSQSHPPAGRKRWTLRLLADRMVELGVVDTLSYETVRTVLKKTR